MQFIGEKRLYSLYSSLMPICNDFADEKTVEQVIERGEKIISADGPNTSTMTNVLSFRSKMTEYFIAKHKYREALKQSDADISRFEKEISKAKSADWFKKLEKDELKRELELNLETAKLPLLVLRSRANIMMGKRKDDIVYGEFKAMIEVIEKVKFKDDSFDKHKLASIAKVYESMATVARAAGDTPRSEEYKRIAAEKNAEFRK